MYLVVIIKQLNSTTVYIHLQMAWFIHSQVFTIALVVYFCPASS